ncbi:T9SS type A sorting domain-containing protein [Hymenobacter sp. IS2118]|uniref:T9SS type A sorting domain-containing protein n=1 Tax=Hymenobacter sp. IS2118 TaxID=1505605 RepID=UPI0005588659|nr:T9SS type A sorting domain-containing protein [Hymenobacter sp. IS2118]
MKKLFTLAAASVLAAGALNAQAQVVLDGQLTAPEITAGNYVLIGKYTNPRGFGDWGLLSLYAATTPTKVYFFVGGTVQDNGNAFQLFLDLPGRAGVPVGTALPAGMGGTSFEGMVAKLDLATDLALALRSEGTDFQIEGASYTSATAGSSMKLTSTAGVVAGNGTPQTLSAAATVGDFAALAGTRVAYRNSSDGKVLTNPGSTTPNTSASYGGVGSFGWEIELDRTATGLATGTPMLTFFVLQNSGKGDFLSSDYIPQTSVPVAGNGNVGSAGAADFTKIADRQAATITLGATGVLGTRAADAAAIAMGVYPNPAQGVATVAYNVGSRSENVNIVLTDLVGRQVQVLSNGLESAGVKTKSVSTADVAAGTYMVRVQVGDKVATRKVVLL